MAKTKTTLSVDLKNQLVALRKQGKTLPEMAEITGLPLNRIRYVRCELIKKGVWSYSDVWKTRIKNQKTQTTASENSESRVKRVYNKRQPQKVDTITINFKGVNVEVQKSSNIIITDTVIYVK
jgi:hypothetical protein